MEKIMENYAKHSYEKLRILQPHVKTKGLYVEKGYYFILCENKDVKGLGKTNQTVSEMFDGEIRTLGCPVKLVDEIPADAVLINHRTDDEVIALAGNPLTVFELNKQLALLIPNNFPKIWIEYNNETGNTDVFLERMPSPQEEEVLKDKINFITAVISPIKFNLDAEVEKRFPSKLHDPLSITVSNHASNSFSKTLLDKWEEDEQLWSDNKHTLFKDIRSNEVKENSKNSTCLINGQFAEAHNIRNYLTLFDELQIVIPIESSWEEFIKSLDVTETDLLKLLELNKVKLIFPHSIQRYKKSLLEYAVSINPANLILSRELAHKTVLDLKQRNPLVFLPTSIDEKQEILSAMYYLATELANPLEQKWMQQLTDELSNTWCSMYELLGIRGAMGTFNVGLGPIINSTLKSFTGKDYFIEIMQASNSIEWAAANNAVLCPVGPLARNEEQLAYLYSGVRRGWNLEIETSPNIATDAILTIAQYVPVVELAQTFTSTEIQRFRQLIVDVTHNKSSEEINAVIQDFNENVKKFEKNRNRIDTWDVKGVTLDTSLEVANSAIPFAGFVTKQIGRILQHKGANHKKIGEIVDRVHSKVYSTSPNVILVSRMRDKVKDLL
ncbi:hypothetical protein IHV12_03645 [Fictibacillus sp. 7GRE50]|uniref:hypothetical protein n=1 Tax=Fictibacillus sp. 7GRE50 TaxID=2745878 RepID=UPI0018CE4DB8|nr:hypothetical protein [Fictibacillus sp. 7GRE50]MBH0163991.1 hypothetical protein [Fictibacillus sp. 7GRE50]